jgi:hypothetical protein
LTAALAGRGSNGKTDRTKNGEHVVVVDVKVAVNLVEAPPGLDATWRVKRQLYEFVNEEVRVGVAPGKTIYYKEALRWFGSLLEVGTHLGSRDVIQAGRILANRG